MHKPIQTPFVVKRKSSCMIAPGMSIGNKTGSDSEHYENPTKLNLTFLGSFKQTSQKSHRIFGVVQ